MQINLSNEYNSLSFNILKSLMKLIVAFIIRLG